MTEYYGAEGGYRFWKALDLYECEDLMEETYYLRTPQKRPRQKPKTRTTHQAASDVPSMSQIQQQYGGDKVELMSSDGEVRSINLSDFSFN